MTSSLTPDWLPRDPLVPAQWINNVTYCGGSRDSCVTEMIVTVANVTMPSPGVVHHDYTDAPLSPQSEVGISSLFHIRVRNGSIFICSIFSV